MAPVSRNTSQEQAQVPVPVPVATVALACSGDRLQRAQQRLLALANEYGERIERLERAFDRLPAAATFDPFAVAAAAPTASAMTATAPTPRIKESRAGSPADALRPASTPAGLLGRVGAAVLPVLQMPRGNSSNDPDGVGVLAGAAVGRSGLPLGTVAPGAASVAGQPREQAHAGAPSLNDWLGSLGNLAGEQVALLMQRHASASAVGLGGAVAAASTGQTERAQPGEAQRRHEGASPLGAARGSAAAQRPSTHLGQRLVPGLIDAFAAVGWPDAPSLPTRFAGAAPQVMATAPQLLEQLLSPGVGRAVGGAIGMSAQPTPLARHPAPRVASRLVGAQASAAADPARAQAPDAPAAAALEALDAGEAMAQQISRLLLDQAWMRGVDLR